MSKTLSLALRPKSFDEMIGQSKMIRSLRKQYESKREPHAILFHGDTGSGKTTVARILALSLQCSHDELGKPCKKCRSMRSDFQISEVNASEVNGVEAIQQIASTAGYAPFPPSKRRVIILDEAQRLTTASQNSLLKPFEEAPSTTVWIICTTEPGKIMTALRGRCVTFGLAPLDIKYVEKLVDRAAEYIHFKDKKKKSDFIEEINKQQVTSPRNILQCFEKLATGMSAEEAVMSGEATVNVLRICQAVSKGDTETAMETLRYASNEDARIVRERLAAYLSTKLVNSPASQPVVAKTIMRLAESSRVDESMQLAYLTAIVHDASRTMGGTTKSGSTKMIDSDTED